ncbi:MAG: Fe-S cluster domain-containing protein [Rikenellaceae bacterium]|nr:Fe-S cluster domain-containing protein [Rikenellaceae bacterium]
MSDILIYTVLTLVVLGVVAAIVLYFVAQKFKVEEDPRIDVVEGMLPGANCGGCGYPGCRGLSEALVKSDSMEGLRCPVGGASVMAQIGEYLGKTPAVADPMSAVVRCAGSCKVRPKTVQYEGAKSCLVENAIFAGETGCSYGCLGKGDCASVCSFGAIKINPETGLPEVNPDLCTACGACVKACPKGIIELRKRGPKDRRLYVSCVNKDKGAITRKACSVGCIGCGKCVKVCPFEAITVTNNVAYIDYNKCKMCRKCAAECPVGAIIEVNFPERKPAVETPTTAQTN